MSAGKPSAEAIAEQAAEWIVRLTADDEFERASARAGFDAWKRADPGHAEMAARLEAFVGQVQGVRASPAGAPRFAHAGLNAVFEGDRQRARSRRGKRIGATLAMVFALSMPTWLALQAYPPSYLAADLRTATRQWATHVLADGSRITLNGASAVNLRYDDRQRTVELVQGEILVDVAKDALRPFRVDTRHGSIRALGTRFVVKHDADATVLDMLESRVSVQTAAQRQARSSEGIVVGAGQRLRLTAQGIDPIDGIDAGAIADAWTQHQLVVNNRPLPEVLDQLARHRPGRIQYDRAQIEHIRVSGVLPLDDTERALQLLLTNFPQLRVRLFTAQLVLIDAPPER